MIDPALLNLLPPLRRARGDRLYGPDAKHWVDLWKQDGAWLLGRRPEGAAREWKNQLDKGLAGWAPSLWPRRLLPLVKQLLPGAQAVRLFRNVDRAPLAPLWRPWDDRPAPDTGAARLVLPTGPAQAVAVAYWSEGVSLPTDDVTSPAEAAGLVHAAAEVLRFTRDPRAQAARAAAASSFDKSLGPTGLFVRSGLWFRTVSGLDYPELFRAHLNAGFLLAPDAEAWGVIPSALSEGEWKAWQTAAEAFVQGRK
jgi:hypothetical protein